jgi:hypothetical protein
VIAEMENEAAGSSPARPVLLAVTSENTDQSVLSNAVSFCASHAHSGLRAHPCRGHHVLSEACVRSAETVRRPHQPGGLCFAPSTPALRGECRQPSALTAGRPGDAQPVSFHSGAATVVGRADAVAYTRCGFATVPRLAIPQRGQSMEGLGAAFCDGLDGRAMSREQLAVACRAGGPW